jgi:XFP N-terminal domain
VIYVIGPGHGGPGIVAHSYLEGSYTASYLLRIAEACDGSSAGELCLYLTAQPGLLEAISRVYDRHSRSLMALLARGVQDVSKRTKRWDASVGRRRPRKASRSIRLGAQ